MKRPLVFQVPGRWRCFVLTSAQIFLNICFPCQARRVGRQFRLVARRFCLRFAADDLIRWREGSARSLAGAEGSVSGPRHAGLRPIHQAAAMTMSEAASRTIGGPDGRLPSAPPSGRQPTFLSIKPLAAFIALIALHFLSCFWSPCAYRSTERRAERRLPLWAERVGRFWAT